MKNSKKLFILFLFCLISPHAIADIDIIDNGTFTRDNSTSTDNIIIGTEITGSSLTSGRDNIAIGSGALANAQGANENIGIGLNSLSSLTSGAGNIALGQGTLNGVTTGDKNISLGADFNSTTGQTGILTIDSDNSTGNALIYGDMVNNELTINGSFEVASGNETAFNDNVTISGTTTMNGALTVANGNASTFNDNVTINGSFEIASGNNVTINDNLTVSDTSNLNNLSVSGISALTNIDASGYVSVGGDLSVTGDVTISPGSTLNYDVLNNLDNVSIGGTLAVTDAATFSDNLTVAGTTTLDNTSITNLTVTNNLSLDNVTVGSNLTVSGTTTMSDILTLNNNLSVRDNASIGGTLNSIGLATFDNTSITTLNVSGTSNLASNLNVNSTTASIAGALSVVGLTTLDNTSITSLNVTGDSELAGNVTVGGALTVTGLTSFGAINADNATIGTIFTDTIKSADGNTDIIRAESDGTVHIGENSLVFDSANDVISSSSGNLTLGNTDNHVTRVRGVLSIKDPTEPDHAATRRYVDQSAAMAAALDTRNPEKGRNFHMQLGGATKNQENAIGLNFSGSMFLVNAPGANEALPFSISAGISNSANNYMGKLSVGLSW